MMTANRKRALILASIMGSLLNAYEEDEKTKAHKILQIKLRKGIRNEIKKFKAEAICVINQGEDIWAKAIDKYLKTHIEASNFVSELSYYEKDLLRKVYGVGQGVISNWFKASYVTQKGRDAKAAELQANAMNICKFVIEEANKELGIEETRRSIKDLIKNKE